MSTWNAVGGPRRRRGSGGGPVTSPYLTTTEAAQYLRYRGSSAIRTLKMRGLLRPVGRRGATDLYRREDLDAFVRGSGTIGDGRPAAPGEDDVHGYMERRVRSDEVPGHPTSPGRLPRARARGGPKDRHAEGEERVLRGHHAGGGDPDPGGIQGRDQARRAQRRAGAREVPRLCREVVEAEDRDRAADEREEP